MCQNICQGGLPTCNPQGCVQPLNFVPRRPSALRFEIWVRHKGAMEFETSCKHAGENKARALEIAQTLANDGTYMDVCLETWATGTNAFINGVRIKPSAA